MAIGPGACGLTKGPAMPMPTTTTNRTACLLFVSLFALLVTAASYLAFDFNRERTRMIDDAARLAVNKAQLISRSFGDTFLAADYVLRDVIGRVDLASDLHFPSADPARSPALKTLLREKAETITGLVDLVLINDQCTFAFVAYRSLEGKRSIQTICTADRVEPGQSLHFDYMPAKNSQSGRPVILMTRAVGSPDGHLLGAAMAVIDLDYAQAWISKLETDSNDVLSIVAQDGLVVARTPALPADPERPHGAISASGGTKASWRIETAPDGSARIVGIAPLDRLPFFSTVEFDLDRVLREWRHRAWQFGIGYVVLALISILALAAHLGVLRQRERMRRLANIDPLTGVYNRRHFMETGASEFDRARRYSHPLSVLMIDIDKFKAINDRWGHLVGDKTIQALSRAVSAAIRGQDVPARLGGEEFSVILPETDLDGAATIAERLRATIEATDQVVAEDGRVVRFTASIGVAALDGDDRSFEAVQNRADKALYRAKEAGRNRVEFSAAVSSVSIRRESAA